ncbi:MAG TPA: MtaA/CmuA family methyltransferase [Desulfitobacteriaceae bacterium]|nr:MtaA/CmuA family methyltransferase [Desulfitobacteriaceae bacterium]
MVKFSPKHRLQAVFAGTPPDRPPVICPGGMMNSAIVDVMKSSGLTLPEAHQDSDLMAKLANVIREYSGFENFGIPFCMTVEAEVFGSKINLGSLACEPKIAREIFPDSASVVFSDVADLLNQGRIAIVVEAARKLNLEYPEIPVLASLTGPISLAASIVDPMSFFRDLRKNPAEAHKVLDYVTDFLIGFGRLLAENGVTAIAFGDPTATGEILGPAMFKKYAVPYLQKVVTGVRETGLPVIVHICGNITSVKFLLREIGADVISVDALINLKNLKEEFPGLKTMGNVSTYLLEFGPVEKIKEITARLVQEGIDIISPACGLSTSSPLENIRAMTQAVKSG